MLISHFSLTEIIKSGYDFINAAGERVAITISVVDMLVYLPAASAPTSCSSVLACSPTLTSKIISICMIWRGNLCLVWGSIGAAGDGGERRRMIGIDSWSNQHPMMLVSWTNSIPNPRIIAAKPLWLVTRANR